VSATITTWIGSIAPRRRLLYLLILIGIATTHADPQSMNDKSRMATVQSLVESGSFVIDRTPFVVTVDKVFINGHFYSDKPPMPSAVGALVYLPLYHAGFQLHLGRGLAYYLVTLLTVKSLWLLGALAFFCCLEFAGLPAGACFIGSLALALGSLYFTWSATFNDHAIAAALLSIGFYFLLKARFEGQVNWHLSAAAFCLSLAGTADMPTGIFYALFFLYVAADARLRAGVIFYLLPLLVTIVPAVAMTYSIHHSVLPVQLVKSYFEYPGSPWIGSDELSGMKINGPAFFLSYGALALVGPRGFLLYNPILVLALWGLVRTLRRPGTFLREAVVIASGSAILVLYYLLFTNNYGGDSYSVRWFVPLLPLLLFFLYPYLDSYGPARARAFRALLAVSVLIASVGLVNPWSHLNYYGKVPFVANVVEFKRAVIPGWVIFQHPGTPAPP
jgi:hypothetical protein